MSVNEKVAALGRRGFLRSVAAAGGAAAAKETAKDGAGYRVTAHVLDYYEKARF